MPALCRPVKEGGTLFHFNVNLVVVCQLCVSAGQRGRDNIPLQCKLCSGMLDLCRPVKEGGQYSTSM